MIDHGRARELASARADGELRDGAGLEEHLAACEACSAFADAIVGLRAMATDLEVERAPSHLSLRLQRRAPRRLARTIAAAAAAVAVALVVVTTAPLGGFRLPGARAAEALTTIETLYVDRIIERGSAGSVWQRTRERIWFRAPGSVRIERVIAEGELRSTSLVIERPGERYSQNGSAPGRHAVDVPPDLETVPEPLSMNVTLLGARLGPGPQVAGRPTERYELNVDGEQREALVDAERFAMLGTEPLAILHKHGATERKHTLEIRYNEPIPDERFQIPTGPSTSRSFTSRPIESLRVPEPRLPDGFAVVRAGSVASAEYIVLARGGFRIVVRAVQTSQPLSPAEGARTVRVGSRTGFVEVPLYGLPSVSLQMQGMHLRVDAPLAPEDLASLVAGMFPE